MCCKRGDVRIPFIDSIDEGTGGTGCSIQNTQQVCEQSFPHTELELVHHIHNQHPRNVKPFTETFCKRVLY
jgi:hypothetical protein